MADAPRAQSPALAAIEPLDDASCRELLRRNRLCTMSVVDGADPYAVPLFYGFDDRAIYVGLAEGRKTTLLDRNPAVCITVVEIGTLDRWESVQATGRATFLDAGERDAAVGVLMEHNRRVKSMAEPAVSAPGPEAAGRRHAGGRILCLRDPILTGRARR